MRRQRPTQRQRLAVFIRAGYRCEYCRHPVAFSSDPFEVEHIIPVEQGGTTLQHQLPDRTSGILGLLADEVRKALK